MLHNKVFWLVIALALGGLAVAVIKSGPGKDQQVDDAISLLKQGDDRSRDCEAFEKLAALAPKSKQATLMIGEMYARNMCQAFDLEMSIAWFQKASLSRERIGSELFRSAMWEMPPSDKGLSKEQLITLLKTAKELGFTPTNVDLSRLPPDFAAIFD